MPYFLNDDKKKTCEFLSYIWKVFEKIPLQIKRGPTISRLKQNTNRSSGRWRRDFFNWISKKRWKNIWRILPKFLWSARGKNLWDHSWIAKETYSLLSGQSTNSQRNFENGKIKWFFLSNVHLVRNLKKYLAGKRLWSNKLRMVAVERYFQTFQYIEIK